jgi:hypothetical protein
MKARAGINKAEKKKVSPCGIIAAQTEAFRLSVGFGRYPAPPLAQQNSSD